MKRPKQRPLPLALPVIPQLPKLRALPQRKQVLERNNNNNNNNRRVKRLTLRRNKLKLKKSSCEGIASGVNLMKGILIAIGNGNLSGQFRVYQNKMAGSAADDKAYGLDSSILDLVAKVRKDFVKPKNKSTISFQVGRHHGKGRQRCAYQGGHRGKKTCLLRSYPEG
jgi:hypothetical protein